MGEIIMLFGVIAAVCCFALAQYFKFKFDEKYTVYYQRSMTATIIFALIGAVGLLMFASPYI